METRPGGQGTGVVARPLLPFATLHTVGFELCSPCATERRRTSSPGTGKLGVGGVLYSKQTDPSPYLLPCPCAPWHKGQEQQHHHHRRHCHHHHHRPPRGGGVGHHQQRRVSGAASVGRLYGSWRGGLRQDTCMERLGNTFRRVRVSLHKNHPGGGAGKSWQPRTGSCCSGGEGERRTGRCNNGLGKLDGETRLIYLCDTRAGESEDVRAVEALDKLLIRLGGIGPHRKGRSVLNYTP